MDQQPRPSDVASTAAVPPLALLPGDSALGGDRLRMRSSQSTKVCMSFCLHALHSDCVTWVTSASLYPA